MNADVSLHGSDGRHCNLLEGLGDSNDVNGAVARGHRRDDRRESLRLGLSSSLDGARGPRTGIAAGGGLAVAEDLGEGRGEGPAHTDGGGKGGIREVLVSAGSVCHSNNVGCKPQNQRSVPRRGALCHGLNKTQPYSHTGSVTTSKAVQSVLDDADR